MGGRNDNILMCVKFGEDPINGLDFSFIGGGTLNTIFSGKNLITSRVFPEN